MEESLQKKAIKRYTKNGNVFQRRNNQIHMEFERGMISRMSWVALKLETLSVTDLGSEFTWGSAPLSFISCWMIQLVKNLQMTFRKSSKYTMFLNLRILHSCPRKMKQRLFEQFCLLFLKVLLKKILSNSDQRQTRCPVIQYRPSCGHQCAKKQGAPMNSRWVCLAHSFPTLLVPCTATHATLKWQVSH